MKQIIPTLVTAAVVLAGCSSTHTLTQNNSKEDKIVAMRNEQVQKDFVYNLILLARCNPQMLDDYAYMYNMSDPYFYTLYFTPFNKLQFTPHKLYLSYDASYTVRNYGINEYVSQYADPYTPAPAEFQKRISSNNNNKYPEPVRVTRGYNYVHGGYIDRATSNKLNNNYASQNNSNSPKNCGYANSAASKYENVSQPQKTYTPAYADNNNNNTYQTNYNSQSTGSQANNNNNVNSGNKKVILPGN